MAPDQNPERKEEAERNSRAINEGYAVLSDPALRGEYDNWLAAQRRAEANQPTPAAPSTSPPPKSPPPCPTQTSEPAPLSQGTILLWIVGIIFLNGVLQFVIHAPQTWGPAAIVGMAGAILVPPLALVGIIWCIAAIFIKIFRKRLPEAKEVLVATTVVMSVAVLGAFLLPSQEPRPISVSTEPASQDATVASTVQPAWPSGFVPEDYTKAEALFKGAESQDKGKAAELYRKVADQGYAPAQERLGILFAIGLGVPQDNAEALSWLRKAAAQGNAAAQTYLGGMYKNGQGVPQDYAKAMEWYRKAAAQGTATAQRNLGRMYENGEGVSQDYAEAVAWYRKAVADRDEDGAPFNLGVMYEKGRGVPQDAVVAYALYNLSAIIDEWGGNPARTSRSDMLSRMTAAQIASGQALTQQMQQVGVLKALDAH